MVWSNAGTFPKHKPAQTCLQACGARAEASPPLSALYANSIKHVTSPPNPPPTSGLLGSRCEAFGVGWDVTCALSREVADSQENASSFFLLFKKPQNKRHLKAALSSVLRRPSAPRPPAAGPERPGSVCGFL